MNFLIETYCTLTLFPEYRYHYSMSYSLESWVFSYVYSVYRGISCSALAEGDEDEGKAKKDASESKEESQDQAPGSNASTLSANSQIFDKDSPNTSFCNEEHSTSEYEIVRSVMYSTRENINIVHEIFRQVWSVNRELLV